MLEPVTAFELVQSPLDNPILSLGCDQLDDLLHGGIRKGITVQRPREACVCSCAYLFTSTCLDASTK